ncbi:MAG TPA: LPS export ABC transporter periplasmic protein LptC [Chitinophagaceae bacterium]|jgi:LPS export ABC transporter protein LptC|nr:LPS export ABC transporter periplasmic protein LptC [Chitinophagaceae bacterium]
MINLLKNRKKLYAAAILTGCCFLLACENDADKVKDWTKKVIMQEEATDIESYLSQNGVMKARLKAPKMIRFYADTIYVEFPKTLHVDFYDDSTQIESRLDSRYGKYFESINKVYLRDSVVVITVKGDTLRSPDLWWDQNSKMFYTDKYAIYHGIGKNIYGGKGLTATQDLSSVIFNQPTGTVQMSQNGMPK